MTAAPDGARSGAIAAAVASLAVVRVLLHAALDARPRFGGSEASDLVHLMRHHLALRGGPFAETLGLGLLEDPYKPPLFYGGVPLLFGWSEHLTYTQILGVQAVALALTLGAAWELGRLVGGSAQCGAWAVAITALLPAVAGRATIVGTEPWQAALLGWTLVGLLRLREPEATWRRAAAVGALIAAGMLVKWTFAFALVGPAIVEIARRSRERRRSLRLQAISLGVAAAPFLLWLLLAGDLGRILASAEAEVTDAAVLGESALLFLPKWVAWSGLGPAGLLILVLGLAVRPTHRGTVLLASSAGGLLLLHLAIPHKEVRYLLPAFGPLAVLAAPGMAELRRRSGLPRMAPAAMVVALSAWTFCLPRLDDAPPLQQHLRLTVDTDDRDLSRLTDDPRLKGAIVAVSLDGPRWIELHDTLAWELYASSGALLLPNDGDVRWPVAIEHLAQADAFLSDHRLDDRQHSSMVVVSGFSPDGRLDSRLPGAEELRLWVRR